MQITQVNPSSSPPQDMATGSQNSEAGSFAFLVHSQGTVNLNLPPEVDNPPLVRQRRRRTSPEDHAILEAEYAQNSKPDKAARMSIVNRVALGEKEVQIWFQNRRQMTRRKTRPLLPHEFMSSFNSSQESSDNATGSSESIDESSQHTGYTSQSRDRDSQLTLNNVHNKSDKWPPEARRDAGNAKFSENSRLNSSLALLKHQRVSQGVPGTSSQASESKLVTDGLNTEDPFISNVHAKRGPGYLANRRSAPFVICQDNLGDTLPGTLEGQLPRTSLLTITPSLPLKRTSSIRLSMSLDGKAQVTTYDESPPPAVMLPGAIAKPRPKGCLQRSQSAIEPSNISGVCPQRSMAGRSRDARTWEFYCDSDARNALTEQAEREQSGSAIGPIGLIRSQSNHAMAHPVLKRNANTTSKHESTKRQKPDGQLTTSKPKLARAMSSVARLQSIAGNIQKQAMNENDKALKPIPQSALNDYYSGDSDKENWEPGTQSRPRRIVRRRLSSQGPRGVLEENLCIPTQSASLDALMNRENVSPRRSYHPGNQTSARKSSSPGRDVDEEVMAFMSAGSAPEVPEDLDCVQNLMSLSQAAWR